MYKLLNLFAVLVCSLPVFSQQCSTPQISTFQDGTVSIIYNCVVVHPGQNAPFNMTEQTSVGINSTLRFSRVSLAYQGGYIIYGNSNSMVTKVSLPDITTPGVFLLSFTMNGSGSYYQQSIVGTWTLNPSVDLFRMNNDVSLSSNIVANCYAYCGYTISITLTP